VLAHIASTESQASQRAQAAASRMEGPHATAL
jgi:hypothetical protein